MNKYEVYYNDNLYVIDGVGKKNILSNDLNVLNITIKNKDYSFDLGNFYTALPYLVNNEYMYNFVKNLVDNIDDIIFKCNRYIGNSDCIRDKCNNKTRIEETLEKIYYEFTEMKKNSKEYIKYSRFLELYFHGHNIPDGIRYMYLQGKNKSILDFNNIDDDIKSSFNNSVSDLKEESNYQNNLVLLEELKGDLKLKEEELNILDNIVCNIEDNLKKFNKNNDIALEMEGLECKLKSIIFFDKNRNNIKNNLKNLKMQIIQIDIEEVRNEIYHDYLNYANVYGDKHGLLILFDKLEIDDILSLIKNIFLSKESIYLNVLSKIDILEEEISAYKDNTVDISDLYERLEG